MKVGELEVLPVLDGYGWEIGRDVFHRPHSGVDDPWAGHEDLLDAEGRVSFPLGGFLVRTGDRVIVIDTGVGNIDNGQYRGGRLLDSLRERGVQPGDVTDVIFTHLHFDHVGWAASKGEVVFRNATYRAHQADWDHFVDSPDAAPGAVRKLSPVKPQLETFSGDVTLAPGLDARPAPGHTPGSTIYILSGGTQRVLLLGDVAHLPMELVETGWEFANDTDRAKALLTRDRISAELAGSMDIAAGAHFPDPWFGRLISAEASERTWVFLD